MREIERERGRERERDRVYTKQSRAARKRGEGKNREEIAGQTEERRGGKGEKKAQKNKIDKIGRGGA